ncbi:MAG: dihydroorotate dehydrogenase electron transfer subunit [Bacteroidota bacterium]
MKRIEDLKVANIRWLNSSSFVLQLTGSEAVSDIEPGNFAQLRIDNHPEVFLRRPFSYLDFDIDNKMVSFFIKAVGKGTRKLGSIQTGDQINIVHPLGNAFTIPENKKVLITGGGSGIAPFIMLGRELKLKGNKVDIITGGRTAEDILFTDEFKAFGDVFYTTEDGSLGEKGLLTQHSIFAGDGLDYDLIYTCGPEGMMQAVASIATNHNITCEASLENLMACGIGACLCCIQETREGNKCVCTDGPVFNINDLTW